MAAIVINIIAVKWEHGTAAATGPIVSAADDTWVDT
jgi:hypothetical protein